MMSKNHPITSISSRNFAIRGHLKTSWRRGRNYLNLSVLLSWNNLSGATDICISIRLSTGIWNLPIFSSSIRPTKLLILGLLNTIKKGPSLIKFTSLWWAAPCTCAPRSLTEAPTPPRVMSGRWAWSFTRCFSEKRLIRPPPSRSWYRR